MKVAIGAGGHRITDWEALSTLAVEAEQLGADALWSAETWAHDGATPLAYLAAKTRTLKLVSSVLQLGTRTPALVAMTAMTLSSMSEGRFVLGLGTSGPGVIEGWHGVPFSRPVQRTREVIEICRRIFAGEPLSYSGELYQIPLDAAHGGSGEGMVLRTDAPPTPRLPIYLASLGPRNLELTGELADGWIGTSFIPETAEVFLDPIRAGAERAGRSLTDVDISVGGVVWFTDDVELAVDELRMRMAFVLGGMGSQRRNFYHAAFSRQGWAEDAQEVRRLWAAGDRDEAMDRIPQELVLSTHLVGTVQMVRQRLRRYRDAGVTTIRAELRGSSVGDRLDTLAQLLELVREVSAEPRQQSVDRSAG